MDRDANANAAARGWRQLLKRLLLGTLGVLVVLTAVVLARAGMARSKQIHVSSPTETNVDGLAVAGRLGQAVRFATTSHQDAAQDDAEALRGLHQFLTETYPRTHAALKRETVGGASLFYTWQGSDPSLPSILLLAHQDVVPVESPGAWKHPPFAGEVADGAVWGRGAMDDKGPLIGILEAVEGLLAEGWRPRPTVYLAFGHDEEVGGLHGAAALAALLEQRGVRPEFVLDEGGSVTQGIIRGIDRPVALVGVAEKGYLSLELSAEGEGGHASMPPPQTAVGIVAAAVQRLEADPFPASLAGVPRQTLDWLAPEMPFGRRVVLSNLWLFGPLARRQLLSSPATAATLRTTTAATLFDAGTKDNVLPRRARAVVNFRIMPGETVDSVTERVRKTIDDPRVHLARHGDFASEPSPVSPADGPGFVAIQKSVGEVAPDAVVAPLLVVGGTDSRHYAGLTSNIYRFTPARLTADDLHMIHGENEHLSVEGCALMVRFYTRLLKNAG